MKSYLKRFVIGNRVLSGVFFYAQRLANFRHREEIIRRKGLSIFDFEQLALPLKYYPFSKIKDNNLYGIGETLQNRISFLDFKNEVLTEHGLILGNLVQPHCLSSFTQTIITFSEYRKRIIEKRTRKAVVVVGPYIQYASSMLTAKEIIECKSKLGKVLLVFPSHSIDSTTKVFNQHIFLNEIQMRKIDGSFDTVLVCLYWKDILIGRATPYRERGFQVVTAGHSYDPNFLNRLKTIIDLADMTMSNAVGTHIGYCIFEGKPHYVFRQIIEYKSTVDLKRNRDLNQRTPDDVASYNLAANEILDAFDSFSESISDSQRAIIVKYWGE